MSRANLYTGKAGNMAVMSEFLIRGFNAAVPEVDTGDDLFVVHDEKGEFIRVQVKTAVVKEHKQSHSAQFKVSISQLLTPRTPEIWYFFVMRRQEAWSNTIIIERSVLSRYYEDGQFRKPAAGNLILRVSVRGEFASCGAADLTPWLNSWRAVLSTLSP